MVFESLPRLCIADAVAVVTPAISIDNIIVKNRASRDQAFVRSQECCLIQWL